MNKNEKDALNLPSNGHSFLLLGSAGTGKSWLVKDIAKELNSESSNVKITCSAGIVCQIYNDAGTVQQFAGIGDGRFSPDKIQKVF